MRRQAKKRTIMTVLWKQQELEDHIAKLNKQLDDAIKLFEVRFLLRPPVRPINLAVHQLQSAIATREDLMQISAGQRFLVERAEDTTRVQDVLLNRTVHIDENMTKVLQHIAVSTVTTDEDGTVRRILPHLPSSRRAHFDSVDGAQAQGFSVDQSDRRRRQHGVRRRRHRALRAARRKDKGDAHNQEVLWQGL